MLDGEVCAIDDTGRASFSAIQQGSGTLVYYVFDLLEQDGESLVDLPLTERRRRLKKLLGRSRSVTFTDTFDDGDALLDAAAQQGLEGVMAKRPDSRYEQGRSRQWLKVKVRPRQELVVAGYTKGQRRRERMGALVLAVHEQGGLRWAGNVGTGFTEDEIDELLARLKPLERSGLAARRRSEDAACAEERRQVGRARARRRGRVRRMDARRPPAFSDLPRDTRGQGARGSPQRGAVSHRDPEGQADA